MTVGIIGAGWSGATAARYLTDNGIDVHVIEATTGVGGNARTETIEGVVYEPFGPHIFHTADTDVIEFVRRFGLTRPFEHSVVTEILPDGPEGERLILSWPPQVDELEHLPQWPTIRDEINDLPPPGDNFEATAVSKLGRTVYNLFVRDYTRKQWGREPSELAADLAPGLELRRDGYKRLFKDPYEVFPRQGYTSIIESILYGLPITLGWAVTVEDLDELARMFDALIITAPLDLFTNQPDILAWRGIRNVARFYPDVDPTETLTPAYVVNRPDPAVPYTRTAETKHATKQSINGTVVCEEHPGSPARHYPVPTPDRRYAKINRGLQDEIKAETRIPVRFTGRLAQYRYINQDQAIRGAIRAAQLLMDDLENRRLVISG